jgi:hypothetical protein
MVLTDRDLTIFKAIQKHGPLPTHYLFEFTRHLARDLTGFKKRLKALTDDGYLDRPFTINHPRVHNDFKIYTLKPKAREILAQAGVLYRFATPCGGGHQHAFMASIVTANIEIAAYPLKFISQEQILAKAPEETRNARKPLSLPTTISYAFRRGNEPARSQTSDRPTEPDQLFGINYGNGAAFFALEADRGTEPIIRHSLKGNSILRKLLAYQNLLAAGQHKKRWGVPNLYPMFVTTADARVENMLALAREIYPRGAPNLLFKAIPGFRNYCRTPPLLPKLFCEPWRRIGESLDISHS